MKELIILQRVMTRAQMQLLKLSSRQGIQMKQKTYLNEAILYGRSITRTADDLQEILVKESYYKYYAVEFMLLQLNKAYMKA